MTKKPQSTSVNQTALGDGNVQIVGDNNTVNQTIIQKFFNIFKSDAETVDQRNRRIMLGHVENFWVKGILEKSLHGAALLDLGIKEDPDALNYPWAIKREANKETLPAGTSMLAIFQEIGMGRSLLILGAPGSGKTTMLLELTRQLIERSREDVTEPIPVVFNLSSWTEKLTLADWLARELNNIYTIPRNVAPTWVKENKMLLLLDGLDEVKQESRDKCVDAINEFRKENGLTSMSVCSRIQDYAELKTRLLFDGAIEIQPLTSKQVKEYFEHFGEELTGIRQTLDKDAILQEMAETPLFLSIMTLAYRDTKSADILISDNLDIQRKHLLETYIERMFTRPERSMNEMFKKQDVLRWLAWLAQKMIEYNNIPYLLENMQPKWLSQKSYSRYRLIAGLSVGVIGMIMGGVTGGVIGRLVFGQEMGLIMAILGGLSFGAIGGWINSYDQIKTVDALKWRWKDTLDTLFQVLIFGACMIFLAYLLNRMMNKTQELRDWLYVAFCFGPFWIVFGLMGGLAIHQIPQTAYPGQKIVFSIRNYILVFILIGLSGGLIYLLGGWFLFGLSTGLNIGLTGGLSFGILVGLGYGGTFIIEHYTFRAIITFNKFLPWKLIPFLDHCVDLIFLRRVGGGYIFVHRLLMEHFAAMYSEGE